MCNITKSVKLLRINMDFILKKSKDVHMLFLMPTLIPVTITERVSSFETNCICSLDAVSPLNSVSAILSSDGFATIYNIKNNLNDELLLLHFLFLLSYRYFILYLFFCQLYAIWFLYHKNNFFGILASCDYLLKHKIFHEIGCFVNSLIRIVAY